MRIVTPVTTAHFNTSHVVVYLRLRSMKKSIKLYFNTSHVVVYHTGIADKLDRLIFQYISCCSLSS